jgi:hypothetical protein
VSGRAELFCELAAGAVQSHPEGARRAAEDAGCIPRAEPVPGDQAQDFALWLGELGEGDREGVAAGDRLDGIRTRGCCAGLPCQARIELVATTGRPVLVGPPRVGGVSVTDALETPAVDAFGGPDKAAVAGARAGADLLLFGRLGPAERAYRALLAKLRSRALSRGRFEQAAERVLDLRAELRP